MITVASKNSELESFTKFLLTLKTTLRSSIVIVISIFTDEGKVAKIIFDLPKVGKPPVE